MDANKVGKAIAFLRRKKGYTQNKLAEKLGVSDKAVSKWERESRGYKPISKEICLIWSSEQGRRANALALGADERRDKLR